MFTLNSPTKNKSKNTTKTKQPKQYVNKQMKTKRRTRFISDRLRFRRRHRCRHRLSCNHRCLLRGAPSHLFAVSVAQCVVFRSLVVGVKEFLEPLEKLEIVLEPSFYQFVYWYYLTVHQKSTKKNQEHA